MEEKKERESTHLKYFGIDRMLPFLVKYKKQMLAMVLLAMAGTVIDVAVPLLQRYALNHFVTLKTLDTLPVFIAAENLLGRTDPRGKFILRFA